jgi:hypothetical protein
MFAGCVASPVNVIAAEPGAKELPIFGSRIGPGPELANVRSTTVRALPGTGVQAHAHGHRSESFGREQSRSG